MLAYLAQNREAFLLMLRQHLSLTGLAVALAIVTGVPMGIVCTRSRRLAVPLLWVAGVGQSVPSLVLLALVLPILGIGFVPAVVAVYARAVLPILLNTYTGIQEIDPAVEEAALGMGMTGLQVLWRVQIPLALPVIVAGVRTAAVQSVAIATLAAFIGAGGLGDFIMRGVMMVDNAALLAGAVPVALLAILLEWLLGWAERLLTPVGVREERGGFQEAK
jgi:osmoprotectant transport system permease protein